MEFSNIISFPEISGKPCRKIPKYISCGKYRQGFLFGIFQSAEECRKMPENAGQPSLSRIFGILTGIAGHLSPSLPLITTTTIINDMFLPKHHHHRCEFNSRCVPHLLLRVTYLRHPYWHCAPSLAVTASATATDHNNDPYVSSHPPPPQMRV